MDIATIVAGLRRATTEFRALLIFFLIWFPFCALSIFHAGPRNSARFKFLERKFFEASALFRPLSSKFRKQHDVMVHDSDPEDGISGLRNFREAKAVGEGTYGVVFKARDLRTNEVIALKKIKLNQ